MFIAFDGIDGGGKSTQIRLLSELLRGRGKRVSLYREPGSTALGESIRNILLHREDIELNFTSEMLLYMASRAQLVGQELLPALERGEVVICDRYLLATVVYQGVAGGLDIESLWQIGAVATQGLRPDLTIVLDLPVAASKQRLSDEPDRLEKRDVAYFEKVRRGFQEQVCRASPHHLVVDASGSIEALHAQIARKVEEVFSVELGGNG